MAGEKSVFEMSDEEVMNLSSAPVEPKAEEQIVEVVDTVDKATGLTTSETEFQEEEEEETEADKAAAKAAAEAADAATLSSPDEDQDGAGAAKPGAPSGEAAKGDAKGEGKPATKEKVELDADGKPIVAAPELDADGKPIEKKPATDKAGDKPTTKDELAKVVTVDDKVAGFDLIMKPFKANGKEIKLDSPEEVVKLLQMGANYTKKMQALQPSMRLLHMLRNNELLDEGKLSFLIDLHNKNPDAIQKLVADSGMQPMDLDADKGKTYKPSDHRVSEAEFNLQAAIEEVATSETGPETLEIVTRQWDADSKKVLYNEPALLKIIDSQRQNGVYDTITAEIDKRKMLGEFQNVPFLEAYKAVGDVLYAAVPAQPTAPVVPAAAAPLGTKVIAPAKAPNGDKAKAASSPRVAPTAAAAQEIDPLSMSDEEFLKQMQNRV